MSTSQHPPAAGSSAMQSVLNLYELSEAILLQLPTSDMLIAAMVRKTWYHIITTSKPVRERLLAPTPPFRPEPGDSSASWFVSTVRGSDTLLLRRLKGSEVWAYCTDKRCTVWVEQGGRFGWFVKYTDHWKWKVYVPRPGAPFSFSIPRLPDDTYPNTAHFVHFVHYLRLYY